MLLLFTFLWCYHAVERKYSEAILFFVLAWKADWEIWCIEQKEEKDEQQK